MIVETEIMLSNFVSKNNNQTQLSFIQVLLVTEKFFFSYMWIFFCANDEVIFLPDE